MHHIITNDSLTIIRDGRPVTLHRGEAGPQVWKDAIQAVKDGNYGAVLRHLDRSTQVHQYFEGNGIVVKGGVLYYGDKPLDSYPARKAVQFWKQGLPYKALVRFIARLLKNPSYRAVQDLYSFLEHNKMPLTDDGCFMAYKAVRISYAEGPRNFVDIYTGKLSNNPGDVQTMDRNEVNEDPYQTCSRGLHVCAYDYLPFFGSGSREAVVSVKVDPADVVAIPVDYNNAKMRVCKYKVIEELTDWRDTGHRWSDTMVIDCDDEDFDDEEIIKFVDEDFEDDDDDNGSFEDHYSFIR